MSIGTVGAALAGAHKKRVSHRDGIPEQIPGANPMEPLGKDHFAATGNAVGKATETTIDTIMKVVKSPEVSIAAVITGAAVVGTGVVGLIAGGPRAAVEGAKLGATIGGGVGLFAAGITLLCDNNLNTHHKSLVAPLLLGIGGGLALRTGYIFAESGRVLTAMRAGIQGARVGMVLGTLVATIATAVQGVKDVKKTFWVRLRPE